MLILCDNETECDCEQAWSFKGLSKHAQACDTLHLQMAWCHLQTMERSYMLQRELLKPVFIFRLL